MQILLTFALAAWFLVVPLRMITMAQSPSLEDTAWVLSALPGRTLVGGTTPTVRFESDRATGSDGCNDFTAPYTSTGTSVRIGPRAASTQKACPDPIAAQARAFMNTLMEARAYRVEAGLLQLLGQDGGVMATLSPQPARSPARPGG